MASIRKREADNGPRYDVRYRDPAGRQRTRSLRTRREAERFAREVERSVERASFVDPSAGKRTFGEYAAEWLATRSTRLRRNTQDLYEQQLRTHILPTFGDVPLARIAPEDVRRWHGELHRRDLAQSSIAKLYRLLRSILATAVEDEMLARNPCKIRGAGMERSDERPVATVDQVWEVAGAIEPRLRAAVLLAGFCGLRLGELLGLQRRDIDLAHHTVRVVRQKLEYRDGTVEVGPPKTDAGRRALHVPAFLLPELEHHLRTFTGPEHDALLFPGANGGLLRERSFNRAWFAARAASSLPAGFRFHDLRHTANTLTAAAGASTRELMARMGHASARAAIGYQHATADRDRVIADLLDGLVSGRALPVHNAEARGS